MQPWGKLSPQQRSLIMGLPNSGKSTFAESMVAKAHRVVWWDPCEEYDRTYRTVLTPAELQAWPGYLRPKYVRLVIQPTVDAPDALAKQFSQVVALVKKVGDLVIVVDEVGDMRKDGHHYAAGDLTWLMRRGRKKGIAPVLVSQIATDFPLAVRKQATFVACFAQDHTDEIDALRKVYGDDFARRAAAWEPWQPPAVHDRTVR